jgi:TonB-dependent receptor
MTMSTNDQADSAATRPKHHPLTLAVAAALAPVLAWPVVAGAQQSGDPGDTIEEIVVQGFRSSLEASLETKRSSIGVVDAITAEDIADFPDLNLAESIQRIPGVSITRVNGEGRNITVRGLPGKFNRIRINGMETINTTGGSDASGGSTRERSFDFNTFASDLFTGIVVRKTPSAEVEEGAIGATVDLRTARPFDFSPGLTLASSIQGGWNDLSEEFNPRFAGLLSHTNADRTFGALVSVAWSDRSILEEGFSTVRWQDADFGSVGGVDCAANPADPGCAAIGGDSGVYHPRIPRYGRLTHEQERLGITGSLQLAPSDSTVIALDALYSEFDATRDEEFLEVFFRSQEGLVDVVDFTTNPANNTVSSGLFDINPVGNGTHPVRSEHRFDELNTDFSQVTLSLDHEFSETFRFHGFAGTSQSDQEVPIQTTVFFDAIAPVTGYRYDFSRSSNTPVISYGSLDVTDPTQFALTEFRDRPQTVENGFDTVAASLAFDLNDALTLSGGLSWKEFEFDTTEVRRESTSGSRVCDAGLFDCDTNDDGVRDLAGAPATGDLVGMVSGFGDGLGAPPGIDREWLSPDVAAAAALLGIYNIPGAPQAGNIRNVQEEDVGAWVQLDFETELGGMPLRGNVGARYVETTTTSTGQVNGVDVTVEREYTDFLPSLNLVGSFSEDFLVRFAVAEVMTRPDLGNLTPGGSLDSFNGPPFEFEAGNPGLDPFRATSFDLAFEWYFDDESLVSLGVFYKDVDSFFFEEAPVLVPFSQTGLPVSLAPASSPLRNLLDAGQDPQIEVTQVQNGGSAELEGFELIYQQPFTFLPGFWQNFGFAGNYTYVDSDKILGFSRDSFNATLYYEDERLSVRLSGAYRDAFRTAAPDEETGRDEEGFDSTFHLDLAFAYRLSDNLDLTFEAINLTDEFERQVFDAGDLVNVYHHFGTEYLLGIRWSALGAR